MPLTFDEAEYYAEDRCATPSEARAEFARNAGAIEPDRAWILTPWDTWEANPAYRGPAVRHPESDCDDDLDAAEAATAPADDDLPF